VADLQEFVEMRRHKRQKTRLRAGRVVDCGNKFICDCVISDMSPGGARLKLPVNVALPEELILFDELENTVALATLRWRDGTNAGIEYDIPPAKAALFSMNRQRALARRYYALKE
jgi:hypothetical protein